jgi:spore germination protein GerM
LPANTPLDGESRNEYIYLFDQNNRLSPVLRIIPSADLKVTDLINELTADLLPLERKATLSTTVPIGLSLAGVTQDNDLAIINFNAGGLEVIEGDELAKALAQIVWTLTETGDLDSIIISIDGDIKTWPTPNSGDQQLLRRIQFMSYAPEVTLGVTG